MSMNWWRSQRMQQILERTQTEKHICLMRSYRISVNTIKKNHTFFICPYSGTYFITVTTYSEGEAMAFAQIRLDDAMLLSAIANGNGENREQASTTVIVHCPAGQNFLIRASLSTDTYSDVNGYITFSGYLLKRV